MYITCVSIAVCLLAQGYAQLDAPNSRYSNAFPPPNKRTLSPDKETNPLGIVLHKQMVDIVPISVMGHHINQVSKQNPPQRRFWYHGNQFKLPSRMKIEPLPSSSIETEPASNEESEEFKHPSYTKIEPLPSSYTETEPASNEESEEFKHPSYTKIEPLPSISIETEPASNEESEEFQYPSKTNVEPLPSISIETEPASNEESEEKQKPPSNTLQSLKEALLGIISKKRENDAEGEVKYHMNLESKTEEKKLCTIVMRKAGQMKSFKCHQIEERVSDLTGKGNEDPEGVAISKL